MTGSVSLAIHTSFYIKERLLITGGGGGDLQNRKIASPNLMWPSPQRDWVQFVMPPPPILKEGGGGGGVLLKPSYSMAKNLRVSRQTYVESKRKRKGIHRPSFFYTGLDKSKENY